MPQGMPPQCYLCYAAEICRGSYVAANFIIMIRMDEHFPLPIDFHNLGKQIAPPYMEK